jgi:hypothetical protein
VLVTATTAEVLLTSASQPWPPLTDHLRPPEASVRTRIIASYASSFVISEGAPHVKGAGQVFCPARLRPAGPMGFTRARRSGRAVKGRPEAEREP